MNVYLNLEIEKRELPAKILLALDSALKGNEVFVGRLMPYLLRNFFCPGIVHFKSITPGNSRINELKFFRDRKYLTTTIDEEHGIIDIKPDYTKWRFSEVTLNLIDKVFNWGDFDYQNLIKEYPKYKKKFLKSGNPRIDLWRQDFKKYYKLISNINIKDYIFFSTNFECFSRVPLKKVINFHNKAGYFKRGLTKKSLIRDFKESEIIFRGYKKAMINLSLKFIDKIIVIRPHPRDDIQKWKQIFKNYENIIITSEGYLSDWIERSKVVVHYGCTGGLEASVRDKFTISYNPVKNLKSEKRYSDSLSKKVFNEKELINKIEKVFMSKSKLKKNIHKSFLKRAINFSHVSEPSYKLITGYWQKNAKKFKKKNRLWFLKINFFLRDLRMKLLLKKYGNHKFSFFNKDEVKEIIERLKHVDKKFDKVSVDFIKKDILRFYCKK
tara:strand:+ start:13208 stop:14524 length:1317 start_codon:yes stop_codon:yes gene_type:complete